MYFQKQNAQGDTQMCWWWGGVGEKEGRREAGEGRRKEDLLKLYSAVLFPLRKLIGYLK